MTGTPATDGISKITRNIGLVPENVMGQTSGCPASRTVSLLGHSIVIADMPYICGLISTYVRPIAILLSAFMALGIAGGALRSDT